ncbi:hypothetical protein [Mycoplasma sp. OR1901]|uniref:hypothetical protein n=1 Tax=Mycoplasma sp. OR1901 TaxID=2742195 RepID=UPI001582B03C|nr:hypothetical protein [Mycoplasma sp. OR1901]QKT05563.1 hypothetical protein HTZ87_02505 [Mycoplasma sp. OR1901]
MILTNTNVENQKNIINDINIIKTQKINNKLQNEELKTRVKNILINTINLKQVSIEANQFKEPIANFISDNFDNMIDGSFYTEKKIPREDITNVNEQKLNNKS